MSEENIEKLEKIIVSCFMDEEFMEDVWKYYLNEIKDWDKDEVSRNHSLDDHECMLNMYVRFDRETGEYQNTEYNNMDTTNQPYSTESTVVLAIMQCPSFSTSKEDMKREFIQSVEQNLYV